MARFLNTFALLRARFVVRVGASRKDVEDLLGAARKSAMSGNRTVMIYSYYKTVDVEHSWPFELINVVFLNCILSLFDRPAKKKFHVYIIYDDNERIEYLAAEPPTPDIIRSRPCK